MAIKPKDILPDNIDTKEINGAIVRKGTIAAVMANCDILYSDFTSKEEKELARVEILNLIPSLVALELHKHVTWKNPDMQKMVEDYLKSCQ